MTNPAAPADSGMDHDPALDWAAAWNASARVFDYTLNGGEIDDALGLESALIKLVPHDIETLDGLRAFREIMAESKQGSPLFVALLDALKTAKWSAIDDAPPPRFIPFRPVASVLRAAQEDPPSFYYAVEIAGGSYPPPPPRFLAPEASHAAAVASAEAWARANGGVVVYVAPPWTPEDMEPRPAKPPASFAPFIIQGGRA